MTMLPVTILRKFIKSFFADNEVQMMDGEAQSPDLSPIENIWKIIGDRARTKHPNCKNTLGVLENRMEQDYAIILLRNYLFMWQAISKIYQL